jgi:hypothetical protein
LVELLDGPAVDELGEDIDELADIAANARRGKNAAAISPVALAAVKRIDALFDIERDINGLSAEERLRVRQEQSAPLLAALEAWLREEHSRLSRSASVAQPIDYMLKRWVLIWRVSVRSSIPTISYMPDNSARRPKPSGYRFPTFTGRRSAPTIHSSGS